jgi:hypothetical protein
MDVLSFAAEIIKALAWPSAAVIIAFAFRKSISQLIPLLTRLKYKDLELEFGREVREVRAEAESALPTPADVQRIGGPPISTDVAALLPVSPRAAVLESWREVEDAAVRAVVRVGAPQPQPASVPPLKLIRILQSMRVMQPEQAAIFESLRLLRNEAAHVPDFALSESSARDYSEVAARLVEYLNSLQRAA